MWLVMTTTTPAVDELLRGLAERGHRITPQRRAILDALSRAGGHVTAEELWFQVRGRARGVNVSTVYRTLQALEALGAVTHAEEPDGCSRYHLVEHAHHLDSLDTQALREPSDLVGGRGIGLAERDRILDPVNSRLPEERGELRQAERPFAGR